jgi:hypothetical protein
MKPAEILRNLENFGVGQVLGDLALRATNRIVFVRFLRGMTVESVDPQFLACDLKYRCGFLGESELRALARNPEYEMPASFLEAALRKKDECYAILDGEVLASYGWYSNKPTVVDPPELVLHFDPAYMYMYKGFTLPAYRGQRLHAIGMTRALAEYRARGYKGLISWVEWNNFASLRSTRRMGYQEFGTVSMIRMFGRYVTSADAGCQRYGFRVEWTPGPDRATHAQPRRARAGAGQIAGSEPRHVA